MSLLGQLEACWTLLGEVFQICPIRRSRRVRTVTSFGWIAKYFGSISIQIFTPCYLNTQHNCCYSWSDVLALPANITMTTLRSMYFLKLLYIITRKYPSLSLVQIKHTMKNKMGHHWEPHFFMGDFIYSLIHTWIFFRRVPTIKDKLELQSVLCTNLKPFVVDFIDLTKNRLYAIQMQ